MKTNPYYYEIVGTLVFAPIVLALETWRRWGHVLSPAALDDWFVFVGALIVVRKLARRDIHAPALWLFVCGGAWFMFCLSLWSSIYNFAEGDPSGLPVPAVIAFKAVGVTLISLASRRALRRLRADDPYGGL